MKINKKIMNLLILAAVAATAMIFTACEGSTSAQPESKAEAKQPQNQHEVRVEAAYSGDVEEVIARATTIKAPESVELIPRTSGQLVELNVEEGSFVKEGQVVARINDDSQKLAVERAKAAFEKAKHDLKVAKLQLDAKILGKEAYLQDKHTYEQAERDYNKAVIELEKTVVTSRSLVSSARGM
jgi:multidrug efflux system membrane fusion protein